jgi:23S rRNA (uracil1939-C5)-methyltransferase
LKRGEILENVPVIDIGVKGKSVAKHDQFVIFTEDAIPGDVVDLRLFRKKKGFGEGKILAYREYSKDRVQPVCSHFFVCGGCTWQNMSYAAQLKFKEKSVLDAMRRIGKLEIEKTEPILGSARTEYYRNRLDFAFSDKRWMNVEELYDPDFVNTEPALGFHISGRFDKVLDIKRCYLQMDPSNQVRLAIREYAIQHNLPFFNLRGQSGLLRSLIIRTTTTGEVMIIIAFYQNDKEDIDGLLKFLVQRFPAIESLYYVINPKANDTTYDLDHILYHGKPHLTEKINGLRFRVGPKSFFQTNPFQAEVLFRKAKEMAGLSGNENVYDLYTGVGSIALYLADSVKNVIGIETVSEAIEFAKANAIDNSINNAKFFSGDVKDVLNDDFLNTHGRPDIIVTDPPRVGMDAEVINHILKLAPAKILYVSCNPATQARDISLLAEMYETTILQPVDMFPHTYHIENIALLVKRV